MSSGQIVAIVVLVVLVAMVVAAVMVFRRRSPAQRRLEAAQHRREAEVHRASAERLEAEAAQRAERARAEQAQAAELAAMARHDREIAEREQAKALQLDPDTPVEPDTVAQPAVGWNRTDGERDRAAVGGIRDRADAEPDQRPSEDPAARAGDRPRRSEYVEPEPIVGGSASGLLSKRSKDAEHTDDNGPVVPAQRSGSPSDEKPTASAADSGSERADTPAAHGSRAMHDRAATDPSAQRGSGDTATAERTDEHATNPVRDFADRILGRS